MRKSSLLALLTLLVTAQTAFAHDPARADEPWYLQLGVGAANSPPVDAPNGDEVDFEFGLAASMILGYDLGSTGPIGWSVELEGFYSSFSLKERDFISVPGATDGDVSAVTWTGNVVADYHLTADTALYVAGGAGAVPSIQYDPFDSASLVVTDDDGVAWQFKAGLEFNMGDQYDVLFGYRFVSTDDVAVFDQTVGATTLVPFEEHVLEIAFRWGI